MLAQVHLGIRSHWKWYCVPLLFGMVQGYLFFWQLALWSQYTPEIFYGSFGDMIMYVFRGMEEYVPHNMQQFQVPVTYLLINIGVAVFVGNQTARDLEDFGKLQLLRYHNRTVWWLGKCLWCVVHILIFYGMLYMGLLFAMFANIRHLELSGIRDIFQIHTYIYNNVFYCQMPMTNSVGTVLLIAVLMPMVTSIALSFLQMCLEMLLSPSVVMVLLMGIDVLSAFFMKWCWLGNYMMIFRYNFINPNGVCWQLGLEIDVCVAVLAIFIGNILFGRYDVMPRMKEYV